MSKPFYYQITVAYQGTHYFGWQRLTSDLTTEPKPTVQGVLERALLKLNHYQAVNVMATSRTDAGVHASGQLAKFALNKMWATNKLQSALNALLPPDIQITQCYTSTEAFNPHSNIREKHYRYVFTVNNAQDPTLADYSFHLTHSKLNQAHCADTLAELEQLCHLFEGTHDFRNFTSALEAGRNTVRTISQFSVHKAVNALSDQPYFYFTIIGDGFLKYQIRYMVGAIFAFLKNKLTAREITNALLNQHQGVVSKKAKPHGLHLVSITPTTHQP